MNQVTQSDEVAGAQSTVEPISMRQSSTRRRRSNRSSRSSWRKIRRFIRKQVSLSLVLVVLISVVVVTGSAAVVLFSESTSRLNSSWQDVDRAVSGLNRSGGANFSLADYEILRATMRNLQQDLQVVRSRADYLGLVANFNSDIEVNITLLDSSQRLVQSINRLMRGVEPALVSLVAGADDEAAVTRVASSGERVIELLDIGNGEILAAQQLLVEGREILNSIDRATVSASQLLQINQLQDYYDQAEVITSVLVEMPELLGVALGLDEAQNYLILAQNNDEIRPSGGYISTYGWLTVRRGQITDFDYRATTTRTPFNPPATFVDSFTIPDWWIRYQEPLYAAWDGSWYADFSQTAALAKRYYDAGNNPASPVDGVIGIDLDGFEYILEAIGSVEVSNYDVVVDADNFRDVVYDIRAIGTANEHKAFVAEVYKQIFEDWQNISDEQSQAVLDALIRSLSEKHIQMYFADADVNQIVELLNWTGAQKQDGNQDYLMVADTNHTPNKSNHSIQRDLTYDANIDAEGIVRSRLSISYDYPDSVAGGDPAVDPEFHGALDYFNLLQVMVPLGSEITDTNNVDRVQEFTLNGFTNFVTRFLVPYDASDRFQIEYVQPTVIEQFGDFKRYRLLIQKQAGMRSEGVEVQVRLPRGVSVVSSVPDYEAIFFLDQTVLDYRFNLMGDQSIDIIYR